MSVIGLFVALSQIDFMLIRLLADLIVNHVTTIWFLRGKVVDAKRCGVETHDLCSKCRSDDARWHCDVDDIDLGDLEDMELSDLPDHVQAETVDRKNVEMGAVVANSVLNGSAQTAK